MITDQPFFYAVKGIKKQQ